MGEGIGEREVNSHKMILWLSQNLLWRSQHLYGSYLTELDERSIIIELWFMFHSHKPMPTSCKQQLPNLTLLYLPNTSRWLDSMTSMVRRTFPSELKPDCSDVNPKWLWFGQEAVELGLWSGFRSGVMASERVNKGLLCCIWWNRPLTFWPQNKCVSWLGQCSET